MTALQDRPRVRPDAPRSLTAVIRQAWRDLISEKSRPANRPQLMERGLERC